MKVLIGSNGGLTGVYLAKRLKLLSDVFIYGADATTTTVGQFFVDKQCILPRATAPDFIEQLLNLLNEEKIDIYLPTHSKEIIVIAREADMIKQNTKARFLVSPYGTYEMLDDKKNANKNLHAIGIPVPDFIEDYKCSYPIIMKNDCGSGSSGVTMIENRTVHEAYKETTKGRSFYEYVKGTEYTLDCMFDAKGHLIGMNQRKRVKTIGGAVSITTNSADYDVSQWIDIITNSYRFCGCVNFQYIERDGIPYFTDINLRYPSGGLPLTVQSGLDIPKMLIDILYYNKEIPHYVPDEKYKNTTMFRYFEEIFK